MEHEAPKTISVPQAGKRYFDLGKNASYEAARRGDLPVIRIGGRLRVPVIALERMLSDAGSDSRPPSLEKLASPEPADIQHWRRGLPRKRPEVKA